MATTRSQSSVWLIGQPITVITGSKLPSRGDVLRRFFNLHKEQKKTTGESAAEVAKEVQEFWVRARIPTIAATSINRKILALFNEWKLLGKSKGNPGSAPSQKQKAFEERLPDLFDCAHAEALALMTIAEDKEFLLAQREKGRRGSMAGLDKKLKEAVHRRERATARDRPPALKVGATVELESSTSESSSPSRRSLSSISSSEGGGASPPKNKRTRGTKTVLSPNLVGALDRTGVSDRQALRIVAATASSLGHDPKELVLNPESIRQSRAKCRASMAEEIKQSFSPKTPLTVHWDGKILPQDEISRGDRLAILVTGQGVEKLLGVPRLRVGTGEAAATAVSEALEDWGVRDQVVAMCFDTTSSNTGHRNGACTLLEKKIGRRLLSVACRHHVHELVIEKAFSVCMGPSSGPDITIFGRFKEHWSFIKQTESQPLIDEDLPVTLIAKRETIVQALTRILERKHPRDDYKELAQLSITCLGGLVENTSFRRPGALHRARWMACIIYALKMVLFRDQLGAFVTSREIASLLRFSFFALEVYVVRWFEATIPSYAPANDLDLAKDILGYHDDAIRKACFKVLGHHFWYLSEHLIGLSLFDCRLPASVKQEVVDAMLNKEGTTEPRKRITLPESRLPTATLASFATKASLHLIDALGIQRDFLSTNPRRWHEDESYMEACHRIEGLRAANDTAERGVSLMQTFNLRLTKDEEQRQFLLQVVEQHRQKQPGTAKSSLPGPSWQQ